MGGDNQEIPNLFGIADQDGVIVAVVVPCAVQQPVDLCDFTWRQEVMKRQEAPASSGQMVWMALPVSGLRGESNQMVLA